MTNRIKMVLEVEYDLNGATIEEMEANLRAMINSAISNGMFTDYTPAEVEQYTLNFE